VHPDDRTSMARSRALAELPVGEIVDASIRASEDGLIAEVHFRVEERRLILIVGEVWEEPGNRLSFHRLDESVLVFTDAADADGIDWIPPRP